MMMGNTSTTTKTRVEVATPSMWRVVMHDDDYTPHDFVVELLQVVFNKEEADAVRIANYIHDQGKAQVGLYTKDIAVTKAKMACHYSEQFSHPLLTVAERA